MKNKIELSMIIGIVLLLVCMPYAMASGYFSYTDDFSYYTNASYTEKNVQMQNNWRTLNSNEYVASSLNAGYDSGRLKVATNTSTVDIKYTTSNANYFPGVAFLGDTSVLSDGQKISLTAQKTHQSDMWGIRFYTHSGEEGTLNYYTLIFGGMYTQGYNTTTASSTGRLTWGLYKCVNGNVTTLAEKTRPSIGTIDDIDGYMGTGKADLNIEILNGKITWSLNYNNSEVTYNYSDVYTDASPFTAQGRDTTVHLYAAGSDDPSRCVYFDNFKLENNWVAPTYTQIQPSSDVKEQTNNIYTNALQGCVPDSKGITDLGKLSEINTVCYNGIGIVEDILVSKDNITWYKLADSTDFVNNEFVNDITSETYRYIFAGKSIGNLIVLTSHDSIKLTLGTADNIRLYARLGGKLYTEDTANLIKTDNSAVAKVNSMTLIPVNIGIAQISATDGVNSVSMEVDVISEAGEYIEPDMVLYKNVLADASYQNGIYSLNEGKVIRRFIAGSDADKLSVYLSNDKNVWYRACTLAEDEQYINLYIDEYKYIKLEGTGSVLVLSAIETDNISLLPGHELNVYMYYKGTLQTNPAITDETGCARISGSTITLPVNTKENIISFTAGGNTLSLKLNSSLKPMIYSLERYGASFDVELSAEGMDSKDLVCQTMIYNSDKSLREVRVYPVVFENGKAYLIIEDAGYAGTYIKVRITDSYLMPYTQTITIN